MELNLQLLQMLINDLYPFLKIKNLNWEMANGVSEASSY